MKNIISWLFLAILLVVSFFLRNEPSEIKGVIGIAFTFFLFYSLDFYMKVAYGKTENNHLKNFMCFRFSVTDLFFKETKQHIFSINMLLFVLAITSFSLITQIPKPLIFIFCCTLGLVSTTILLVLTKFIIQINQKKMINLLFISYYGFFLYQIHSFFKDKEGLALFSYFDPIYGIHFLSYSQSEFYFGLSFFSLILLSFLSKIFFDKRTFIA